MKSFGGSPGPTQIFLCFLALPMPSCRAEWHSLRVSDINTIRQDPKCHHISYSSLLGASLSSNNAAARNPHFSLGGQHPCKPKGTADPLAGTRNPEVLLRTPPLRTEYEVHRADSSAVSELRSFSWPEALGVTCAKSAQGRSICAERASPTSLLAVGHGLGRTSVQNRSTGWLL
jgi:hypothetical protein